MKDKGENMKKYKKPVLDIVEFDNLDVVIMSLGGNAPADEENGGVLTQTYNQIDVEGNSAIDGAENQLGGKDDSSEYDNTVGDNDSLDNTVGDNGSSDNTIEGNNPLDDTSDQEDQIDTNGGTVSENE